MKIKLVYSINSNTIISARQLFTPQNKKYNWNEFTVKHLIIVKIENVIQFFFTSL